MPTLLVSSISTILEVNDPGIVTWFTPSPAFIPARALPLIHFMSPYKNITNESF